MRHIIQTISIIGIIVALAHMVLYAIYQYDPLYFFIGLGIIYLFVPLVRHLDKVHLN
jgi:hypothetical protein